MKYILKKAEVSNDGGFIGDGKLSPASKTKDSWIMKQIMKKQMLPGIKRTRDKDGILKFSSLKQITENIFHSFSNVEKNYSIVNDNGYFCVRLAWCINIFCDDEFIEIKDVEFYSKTVTESAKDDIEQLMINPIKVEGSYDLKNKNFSICATAIIPIEFVQYFKDELEKRGF